MEVHNTGLDHRKPILYVDGENAVHPLKLNHDPALNSERAAAQSCTGPTGQKRNAVLVREADDLRNLFGSARKHNEVGPVFEQRQTVAFIDEELRLIFNDSG